MREREREKECERVKSSEWRREISSTHSHAIHSFNFNKKRTKFKPENRLKPYQCPSIRTVMKIKVPIPKVKPRGPRYSV